MKLPDNKAQHTVSLHDARVLLSPIIHWIDRVNGDVILTYHGAPKAVIISCEEFKKLESVREGSRRHAIWGNIKKIHEKITSHVAMHNVTQRYEASGLSKQIVGEILQLERKLSQDQK